MTLLSPRSRVPARRLRPGLLLALLPLLAGLGVVVPAAPASAAPQSIILSTNGDATPYVEAGGMISFPRRGTFKITRGYTWDRCDGGGDGHGAYLKAFVGLTGPKKFVQKKLGIIAKDDDGCSFNPVTFPTFKRSYAKNIRYVTLRLCEINASKAPTCLRYQEKTYRP
ncbi:hypothetical protein [Nocardioides sp. SYSU D00038]|uniref:hypothetical protein n=1 Tax=Nocardioides sp. SYSU D00038 TaxID=2812554 RepID=UPI0019684E20|nr:hypothetical protein [Nocardioides sp. SYSU D00038]